MKKVSIKKFKKWKSAMTKTRHASSNRKVKRSTSRGLWMWRQLRRRVTRTATESSPHLLTLALPYCKLKPTVILTKVSYCKPALVIELSVSFKIWHTPNCRMHNQCLNIYAFNAHQLVRKSKLLTPNVYIHSPFFIFIICQYFITMCIPPSMPWKFCSIHWRMHSYILDHPCEITLYKNYITSVLLT